MIHFFKIITIAIALSLGLGFSVQAQTELITTSHPLETNTRDPLLPETERALTPVERSLITQTTNTLDKQASALLQAGKETEAFNLWYRQLKLQRALGFSEELQGLGKIGAIAWDKNRKQDIQAIDRRLLEIEPQVNELLLLNYLALAYQQIRNYDKSIEIYQQALSKPETQQDVKTKEQILDNIGKLQLGRFDYPQAAATYEELLSLARSRADKAAEGVYLEKLADIYSQANEPQKAVLVKQQLIENYQQTELPEKIPALKISVGDDYKAANQPQEASQNYQEAFELAWSLQKLSTASEALVKLGELYQQNGQYDGAIQIYQKLLQVESVASNLYGLMTTYDRLGQIFSATKNYQSAIKNYQKGLEIAKTLNYRQNYFNSQIEEIKLMLNN